MATIAPWKSHVNVNLLDHPVVAEALAPSTVEQLCRQVGHRWRRSFCSPRTMLVTFLLQVLDRAKTLRAAVALLLAQLAGRGVRDLPCCDPTAYCQARMRLPLEVVTGLLRQVADQTRHLVTSCTWWLGRRVWMVDGSSATCRIRPSYKTLFPRAPTWWARRSPCTFWPTT